MSELLAVLHNELMKMFKRRQTLIMSLFLVLLILLDVLFIPRPDIAPKSNWEQGVQEELNSLQQKEMFENLSDVNRSAYERQLTMLSTQLEKRVPPLSAQPFWGYIQNLMNSFNMWVIVFMMIALVTNVADEFSRGTIKLLLIRTPSRSVILFSKYVAGIVYFFFMYGIALVTMFVMTGFIHGYIDWGGQEVLMMGNQAVVWPAMVSVFYRMVWDLLGVLPLITFAFMLASLFRSSAVAIGISIFLIFVGRALVLFLYYSDKPSLKAIAPLLPFAHGDLMHYFTNPVVYIFDNIGSSLTEALTVNIVYTVVFYAVAWLWFVKRDVI